MPSHGPFPSGIGGSHWKPPDATSATCRGWWEVAAKNVTLNAGNVASVSNLLGGSDGLVQAVALNQPLFESGGWGSRNDSLQTDGGEDILTSNAMAGYVTGTDQPFSVVAAIQALTLGISVPIRTIFGLGKTGDDVPLHDFRLPADVSGVMSSGRRDSAGISKIKDAATAITTNRSIYTFVFTGTRVLLRVNFVQDANLDGSSASADADVGVTSISTFSFGGISRIGISGFTNARLGMMLFYQGALNAFDIAQAERYVANRYPP